jgi:RNA polymerase sigma factor (sigma-70 family)
VDPRGQTILDRAARAHAGFLRERLRVLGVPAARLDDAAQDVLEVLARRIDAYDERYSVRQWMAGVARNVARHHRRRATREPAPLDTDPVSADDPERAAARREACEVLARFLDELDEDRWAVFVLSEIEGLRGTEIAAELDVKLSTVYARLRSAQRGFDRALARRRARERRWSWLAIAWWRPGWSVAAVSTCVLTAMVVATLGIVAAWILARGESERVVVEDVAEPELVAASRAVSAEIVRIADREDAAPERPVAAASPTEDPTAPTDVQREAIENVAALYREFDETRYRTAFDVPEESWILREQLEWFASAVGECGEPEPLEIASETSARFVFRCETGELEIEIALVDATTPRMRGLRSGVRGVDPPEVVRVAAERALALYHDYDAAVVPGLFEEKFDPVEVEAELADARAKWGACTLGDVDLARHRGALFDLHCESGLRLMKVELAEDDRITNLWFTDPRPPEVREG